MKKQYHIIANIVMIAVCFCILYPFLIIVGSSFQTQNDITLHGYRVIPNEASLAAYKMILKDPSTILNAYKITIMTTAIGTFLGLFVTASCGYVMSRKSYRYRNFLAFYMFVPMLFSGGMVASYIWMTKGLGLKNSLFAMILPYVCSAWNILLMRNYMVSVPDGVVESAKIDGASELRIFFRIVIPMSTPAIATIGLMFLLQYWNDWYLPMLYIEDSNLVNLQYLLQKMLKNMDFLNSAEAISYGLVNGSTEIPTAGARMAMCILAAGPMLVVFPFFQKYFVKGLVVGSIKG